MRPDTTLPPIEKQLSPAIARAQECMNPAPVAIPLPSARTVKQVAWWTLAIVLFIPCVPFFCLGLFSIAWAAADLCCERPSDAWFAVWLGISLGTIPAGQLSFVAYTFWRDRRNRKRQQAHPAEIAAAMTERQAATLH
jgi:hypothetical protein